MKFSANNGELQKALETTIAAATLSVKGEHIDAFKITLRIAKDAIKAEANNGNVAITAILSGPALEYKFESEGNITVFADDFANVLKSFSKADILTFAMKVNSVCITTNSDAEEEQTIPVERNEVEMPVIASNFGKTVTLRRSVLQRGMEKVLFAVGFEKYRPEFHYWLLRLAPKSMRAVAGDGTRFASYDITGENIIETDKDTTVVFYREHNQVLQKVINLCTEDYVTLREYTRSNDKDSLQSQTIISLGNVTLALIGHDPRAKWPNENRYLERKNNIRLTVASDEWDMDLQGIMATRNRAVKEGNEIHNTLLSIDMKKKSVTAITEHAMQSRRRFTIEDADTDGTLNFRCETKYLTEIMKYAAGGHVQFEFLDEKAPAIVHMGATAKVQDAPIWNDNEMGQAKEAYVIFFVSYKKP